MNAARVHCCALGLVCVMLLLSWRQVIKCADAGADLVRITVQGKREAKSCKLIREKLNELVRDRKTLYCKEL